MSTDKNFYYGTYCILDKTSGDSGVNVDGNMAAIGGELDWTPQLHVTLRGKEVPRVVLSRGENALGFLPENVFKQVKKCLDAGWTCRAFSSLVIFDKLKDSYLIEVAVICYADEHATEFARFAELIAARIAKGEHPGVALSEKEVAHVLEAQGAWADTKPAKLPALKKGSALYKTKQTMTERIANAAASKNKGCYIAVVAVLVVIIAAVLLLVFR